MAYLPQQVWEKTFSDEMKRLDSSSVPPFEFWPYFDQIPEEDFEEYDCSNCEVEYVYSSGSGGFVHVLVNSDDRDIFMVVVLDLSLQRVAGHRLVNFRELYGLE